MENNNLFHNRYFLERLLGRGNFSEVWLAKDDKTDIQVALKIYAPATGLDSHGLNVLSREFAIVVNANHKNLLKPLYYDSVDRKPYLVLPYCKNGSIQRFIGQFTEEQAWLLLRDVASGLAYLHSRKPVIIHQDIKPDNIMIDENGTYMITDFGISAHAMSALRKSMSTAFVSAGTTAYMAPERFDKDNTPVRANDIWSLGAMTYEMLTGNVPFSAGNVLEGGILQKQGAEIPLLPEHFSPELQHLLELCLQKEPWERPTAEQVEKYSQIAINGGNPFPKPSRFGWFYKAIVAVCLISIVGISAFWGIKKCTNGSLGTDTIELSDWERALQQLKSSSTAQGGFLLLEELSNSGDAEATFLLSRLYFKGKSGSDIIPDSIRLMQRALQITPDNAKAHELLLKAEALNPDNYYVLYELGCDYLAGELRIDNLTRDVAKADSYFRRALSLARQADDEYYLELIPQQIEKYNYWEKE